MCGRYTVTRNERIVEELEAALDLSAAHDPWWKPRFNVAPTQPAPIVTLHDGVRTIELMRWGLVPHWAGQDGKRAPLMINARLESVNAKQVFRDSLARKRCLVPADGFFEWVQAEQPARKAGKKSPPQPFYFHPRSHGLCAFAGLWARSHTDSGDEQHSFTIITTRANDLVSPVHDRMPIVLDPSMYAAWLDPAVDGDRARALLDRPIASTGPASRCRRGSTRSTTMTRAASPPARPEPAPRRAACSISMPAKRVRLSIDRKLLERIDRYPQTKEQGRSAFIRDAALLYLATKSCRNVDRQIATAYRTKAHDLLLDAEAWLGEQAWPEK